MAKIQTEPKYFILKILLKISTSKNEILIIIYAVLRALCASQNSIEYKYTVCS